MIVLFRAMQESPTGLPVVGSRTLGVRPGIDVLGVMPTDSVIPGTGGLSVSPDDPLNLPVFRRPPLFGGTGKDPVWVISADDLGPDLVYRRDPTNAAHGFVEPARTIFLDEYQLVLSMTQLRWRKVHGHAKRTPP
jgi:hypothetical protein